MNLLAFAYILANAFWTVFGIVMGVIVLLFVALYFYGRKLQKKQAVAEQQIQDMKQTVSMLIIDKKMLRPAESGLPAQALGQLPWYAKRAKLPVVKAKVGPQVMTLLADKNVFDILPLKKECKVAISGIYIVELKTVRGGKVPEAPKKQGVLARIRANAQAKVDAANKELAKKNAKKK